MDKNTRSWNLSIYSNNKINSQSNLDFEKFSSRGQSRESRLRSFFKAGSSLSERTWPWRKNTALGVSSYLITLTDCHYRHRVINLLQFDRTFPVLTLGTHLPSPLPVPVPGKLRWLVSNEMHDLESDTEFSCVSVFSGIKWRIWIRWLKILTSPTNDFILQSFSLFSLSSSDSHEKSWRLIPYLSLYSIFNL